MAESVAVCDWVNTRTFSTEEGLGSFGRDHILPPRPAALPWMYSSNMLKTRVPTSNCHFRLSSPPHISGPPTLVKQDVKYFPPQAVRERESALAVAAGRTNLSELARVNSGNEARPGTR